MPLEDIIQIVGTACEHPSGGTFGTVPSFIFPGDEILLKHTIQFDASDPEAARLIFKSLKLKIYARIEPASEFTDEFSNEFTGEEEFELESFSFNFTGQPKFPFGNPNVLFEQNRQYKLPVGHLQRLIKISTINAGDGLYFYTFKYPVICRWEYWKPLAGVNDAFLDYSLPNNGKNQLWWRYNGATLSPEEWQTYYRLELNVNFKGEDITIREQPEIGSPPSVIKVIANGVDYDSNSDYDQEIKTYSSVGYDAGSAPDVFTGGGTPIPGNGILSYADTWVQAKFTKQTAWVGGAVNQKDNISGFVWLEPFEGGGVTERLRASSTQPPTPEACFTAPDPDNSLMLVNISFDAMDDKIVYMTALIDHTKLPPGQKFTVYARLYDMTHLSDLIE